MCIFVASSQFTDYALVLLDNRDEYLDRATTGAHLWPSGDVFGPVDKSKSELGTWMGLSAKGRVAVLVNIPDPERAETTGSRGTLAAQYLTNGVSRDWIKENSSDMGGFQLLMGNIHPNDNGLEAMELISHKNQHTEVFGNGTETIAVSNTIENSEEWPKIAQAKKLAEEAFDLHGPELMEKLWSLLATASIDETATLADAKKSIFIPVIEANGRKYGTRTQTIVLVDYAGNAQYLEKDVTTGLISTKDWVIDI